LVLGGGELSAQTQDQEKTKRAEILEAQATSLLNTQETWDESAQLLREAAALRPEGDAQARKDLFSAARLEYYRGKESRALRQLEGLAERSLQEGDVLTAALALADAAWIANEEGMIERTLTLSERVRKLALSPHLTDDDRESLNGRFAGNSS